MGNLVRVALYAALSLCALHAVQAAESQYPSRPIRAIVPFPPGGPTDVTARIFGQKLSEAWGQQMVIDNRTGAGGNIGMGLAANSAGDGYTYLFVSSSLMVNPGLYKSVPYDVYRSFVPVSVLAASPHVFFAHPAVPVKTLADLVNLVKKDPNKYSIATPGVGTVPYLSAYLFAYAAKINLTNVPYAGGGPSIAAVVGNQVQFGCQAIPPVTAHIKAGTVRALAVTSAQRTPIIPEVPTMAELGFKEQDSETITGLLVPAGTPAAVVKKLHGEVVRIMALPDVRQRMSDLGADISANTPQEFTAQIKREATRWARVIKDAHIPAN
jgi:tripartite-type tricarboxylate transporter receptor subunit TctC